MWSRQYHEHAIVFYKLEDSINILGHRGHFNILKIASSGILHTISGRNVLMLFGCLVKHLQTPILAHLIFSLFLIRDIAEAWTRILVFKYMRFIIFIFIILCKNCDVWLSSFIYGIQWNHYDTSHSINQLRSKSTVKPLKQCLSLFSTRWNFARGASCSTKIVQQQSWKQFDFLQSRGNVAPRAKFRLLENGVCLVGDVTRNSVEFCWNSSEYELLWKNEESRNKLKVLCRR